MWNFFCANRYLLHFKTRKTLGESLNLSQINYCCLVCFPCLDYLSKSRIQYTQNNCCLFIFGLRYRDHVSHQIFELRWLKMEDLEQPQFAVSLLRLMKNQTPSYLHYKLFPRNFIHNLNSKVASYPISSNRTVSAEFQLQRRQNM